MHYVVFYTEIQYVFIGQKVDLTPKYYKEVTGERNNIH